MESSATEWAYANNGRIALTFLGLAIVFVVLGLVAVITFGSDAATAGAASLTLATFLIVFSLLVFLPRLARRGARSFSVFSRRSMDEAERAVREAIEATGRTPKVDHVKSRSRRPPRIVSADGIPTRFRIEATRHPAAKADGADWTEIIESFTLREQAEAQALRDKITERLAVGRPGA